MSDDFQPRKHDALVEPMFEALGGEAQDSEDQGLAKQEAASSKGRGQGRLLWILLVPIAVWVLVKILGGDA